LANCDCQGCRQGTGNRIGQYDGRRRDWVSTTKKYSAVNLGLREKALANYIKLGWFDPKAQADIEPKTRQ
jgi:hypothetical protein